MRLLMTTDTVGGVWTFAKELAEGLLQRGCTLCLVSFGRLPSPDQQEAMDRLAASFPSSFRSIALDVPLEWMPNNAASYTSAESLLLDLCRALTPDALLLSQFCFGALPLPVPKIVIAHSDVLSWAAAVGRAPLTEDAWLVTYKRLVQRGLNGADGVVAPTRAMLNDLCANFDVAAPQSVIPNGRTLADAPTPATRKLAAVTAGRMWDAAKNMRLLAKVVSPVPIRIAGENSGEVLPAESNASFVGRQSEADLLALFAESAIYLCTSTYEPFGLAPLEAALCGCAVLAKDIPSLREVWADAALYFEDASSLSALLQTLTHDGELLQVVRERCYRRALRYRAGATSDAYFELVARMVEAKESTAHAA